MKPENVTSPSLLQRVRGRDEPAWQRLVLLYGPLVRYWCQQAGVAEADREDVAQEVFVAVGAGVADFQRQGVGSFRAWIRGITRHKVLDQFRKRQRAPASAGGTDALQQLQEIPDPATPADDAAETTGLYRRAIDLIRSEFEERSFQAFWQAAVEGQPTDLVASQLGMSPVAVRIAKSRILARLREEVGDLIQ